jgi:Aldehyde dehydrogenase family
MNIVLSDADPEVAIAGAANAIFFNHGQCCVAGSRLFVHEGIFDEVVDGVAEVAKSIKLGEGMDPETQMGPLVSDEQLRLRSHNRSSSAHALWRCRVHPGRADSPGGRFRIPWCPLYGDLVVRTGRRTTSTDRWLLAMSIGPVSRPESSGRRGGPVGRWWRSPRPRGRSDRSRAGRCAQ